MPYGRSAYAVRLFKGCGRFTGFIKGRLKASGKADSSVSDYDNTTTEPETDKPEFDLNDQRDRFSQEAALSTAVQPLSLPQTRVIRYTTPLTHRP